MPITQLVNLPNSVTRQPTFAADIDAIWPQINTFATEATALAAAMTAVAAGGAVSLQYTFDTTTTDSDPGAGKLRLNQAAQNTATVIRADLAGSDGSALTDILALLDDSTSTNKGYITLRHATTATKWLVFSVASVASPAGYRNITATCVASSAASPFTNADAILFDFTPTGDKGETGSAPDLTGHVTSVGAATVLGSFTFAQLNTAVSDADVASLGANTFSADQTLAENAGLVLDAALSADGKYSGIVEAGTSSAALAFGDVCYRVTATGKWALAKANAASTSSLELGLCVLAAVGADAATTMLLFGKVRADALFDTFTVGAPVYISAATAGKTVSAAPSGVVDYVVRKIGFAEDANTVFFRPDAQYVTIDASSTLKTVGAVALPAVASGALTLLSTVTASNSATVDVETTFNSTYDSYLLVISGMTVQTDNTNLDCQLKVGGAYDTGNNYKWEQLEVRNAISALYSQGGTSVGLIEMINNMSNAAASSYHAKMEINSPASTAFMKTVSWHSHSIGTGTPHPEEVFGSGANAATTALTGIRFLMSSGNIVAGKFRLYGIANS